MREEIPTSKRVRPLSPNIQIYRPQLTSVLSINRITGVVTSVFAVLLVVWLTAAAAGPQAYSRLHPLIGSWFGQAMLMAFTLAFFVHLCGGIRHLLWDAGYGFELRTIYASGWAVVFASVVLTAITWIARGFLAG
ncbi:succinate dehydrogenase, cytochrome b556 subunit [Mesorhizobium sp. A556]